LLLKCPHSITHFLLLPFAHTRELQLCHFWLFLGISLAVLLGNGLIITSTACDQHLHTPMYFFLLNLSLLDLGCILTTVPKSMANSLWDTRAISYTGCAAQLFFFLFFIIAEFYLLTVMSYDRYVAICKPLHYGTLPIHFHYPSAEAMLWSSSFCGPIHIDHFFCDVSPVLKLVCSDTHSSEMVIFAFVTINVVGTSMIILLSYISIIRTVLRMCSAQSRARAFHTCASHLMAVSLFFGPAFFMYLQPSSSHRSLDKVASIFYAVVTPMLNPFIYSLRNKEVKGALLKCRSRFFNHWQHRRVLSLRT
uniref:Olfactory receptor n=1 Tax=Melopsittacus undulatus TaxID=13146 RepID=A0A8V5H3B6_MELUD